MKIRLIICFCVSLFLSPIACRLLAQNVGKSDKTLHLNGYRASIEGENLNYHCFDPYATRSLLTRCTEGTMNIRWMTDSVSGVEKKTSIISYSWICGFSSGTSHGDRRFLVRINDRDAGEFRTRLDGGNIEWVAADSSDATRLSFRLVYKDAVGDCFGYMILEMPVRSALPAGQTIDICGTADHSNDWYMIFERNLNPQFNGSIAPAIVQQDGEQFREIALYIVTPFPSAKASIRINGSAAGTVDAGYNNPELNAEISPYLFLIADSDKDSSAEIEVAIGDMRLKQLLKIPAVTVERIFLLPHSHNDIGYTDLQPEILKLQINYLKSALDIIDSTRRYPEGNCYKWNSEVNWSLEAFLETSDSISRARMISAIHDGNIGVNGLFSNPMSGIGKAEELMRITETCRKLKDKYGIECRSAMITDVPGLSWSMVPALYFAGIRYLSWGPNYFDRIGWSTEMLGDKPFYWMSPSGQEKILVWISGRGYSFFHGYNSVSEYRSFPQKLFSYLIDLNSAGYPYDMVQLRCALYSDNGPNDPALSGFVQEWNKRYSSPKLIIATTDEMFAEFEARYGDKIPALSGDFTPYWEDGALSTARELGLNRRLSEKTNQLETAFMILDQQKYDQEKFYRLWQNISLFTEHTWGAFNSVTDPDLPFAKRQWDYKLQFYTTAEKQYGEMYSMIFPDAVSDKIEIVNTSEKERSEVVIIELADTWPDARVFDVQGNEVVSQRLDGTRLAFMAGSVPALGSAVFTLQKSKERRKFTSRPAIKLDTPGLSIEIDPETGALKSLFDKAAGREWCAQASINHYVYVKGLTPETAQGSEFRSAELVAGGPLLYELKVHMDAPGAESLSSVYTVFANEHAVRIVNTLNKTAVREKEAAYFAFPFNVAEPIDRFDAGWTEYGPGLNQLAGSCCDFFYAMRWADVSGAADGITLTIDEAPLLEVGEISDESRHNAGAAGWKKSCTHSSVLYSYIINNYWHTNFKADQAGQMTFSYMLVPHNEFDRTEAYRQSQAYHQPLMVRYGSDSARSPLFRIKDERIILTSVTPAGDGKGVLLHFFNSSDQNVPLDIEWNNINATQLYLSNTLGERIGSLRLPVSVPPAGTMIIGAE